MAIEQRIKTVENVLERQQAEIVALRERIARTWEETFTVIDRKVSEGGGGTMDYIADQDGGAAIQAARSVNANLLLALDASGDYPISCVGSYARGSIIRGGTSEWEAYSAKTSGRILVGDGTDLVSVAVSGDATLAANGALTVDHDACDNFLADEHVAHSGVVFTAGNGLTGGGDISASRTLAVGAGDGIDVAADAVAVDVTDFIDTNYGLTENANDIRLSIGDGLEFDTGALEVDLSATSGLEFSSGDLQLTDSIAGAGLTIASKVLAVGAGDGIVVATDAVAVDLVDAWSGLEFSGGDLRIDLDAAFTWAGEHDFDADVTVTNDADFTVGANILFVNADQANVGINCAPDNQFDLDVGGTLRAQGWIVGKHAIQLPNARMICHYDGPEPYETDFTFNPTGHMGQVATTAGAAIGVEGKFGKGVSLCEGHTNEWLNPTFTNNVTDGISFDGQTGGARAQYTSDAKFGVACCKLTQPSAEGDLAFWLNNVTVTGSSTWTFSVYAKDIDVADIPYLWVRENDGSTTTTTEYLTSISSEWSRFSITVTMQAGTTEADFGVRVTDNASPGDFLVDACQVVESDYALPYRDGSMPGCSWSGTAHNSTTVVTAAQLYYDSFTGDEEQGSVSFWWQPSYDWNDALGENKILWRWYATTGARNDILVYQDSGSNGLYCAAWKNDVSQAHAGATPSWSAGDRLLVTLTWDWLDAGEVILCVNGVEFAKDTSIGSAPQGMDRLILGASYPGGLIANGTYDDMAITGDVMDPDLVRAIYESNAPVFAETSTFGFRTPTPAPIWADSEGLWVKDTDGNAIFGIYAADSTKSWGGKTLATGDILFGREAENVGWMLWDADGDMSIGINTTEYLSFGADGAVITNKLLMPGADSAIAIGATPPTAADAGTGIWIDRTGFYSLSSGTYQVKINATDGRLYAGGGNVVLDENGVRLDQGSGLGNTAKWYDSSDLIAQIYGSIYGSPEKYGLILKAGANGVAYEGVVVVQAVDKDTGVGYGITVDVTQVAVDVLFKVQNDMAASGGIVLGSASADPDVGCVHFIERSSDPGEPAEGEAIIWLSDGTGKGDDGDVMVAVQAGGTTKYGTLFDHSAGAGW